MAQNMSKQESCQLGEQTVKLAKQKIMGASPINRQTTVYGLPRAPRIEFMVCSHCHARTIPSVYADKDQHGMTYACSKGCANMSMSIHEHIFIYVIVYASRCRKAFIKRKHNNIKHLEVVEYVDRATKEQCTRFVHAVRRLQSLMGVQGG